MKIYRKVVLNLQGEIIEEDSYEYAGPVAECKGGGGSSGKMEWPGYMQTQHQTWLTTMNGLMTTANPYTGLLAYDPATYISAIETQMTNLIAFYDSIGTTLTTTKTSWETLAAAVQVKIDALLLSTPTSAFLTSAQNELSGAVVAALDADTIGRFEAGMRDINAVQTSSFVLGKAALYTRVGTELTKLTGAMRLQTIIDRNRGIVEGSFNLFSHVEAVASSRMALVNAYLEKCRLDIIAKKEQLDKQTDLDISEAQWPFFLYQQAGNLLGSIGSGGGAASAISKPNPVASTLGGAMAGAGAGAMIGSVVPGIGTAVGAIAGAVIGGIGGYFSSQ